MTAWLLAALLASSTRLVVGVESPDLRAPAQAPRVRALTAAARGREVARLPFAIVIEVPDAALARAALRRHPEVRWIEEETRIVVARRAPNDPLYPLEWHLHPVAGVAADVSIGIEAAWAETRGRTALGVPIRIAVVDDGFALDHVDLAGRYVVPGRNFSSGIADDDVAPGWGDHHGTQTAGVIAAEADNGAGVAGVCPECALVPVRLLGGGGPADLYEIESTVAAAAIVWAYETAGADVINNSWGPPDGNPYDPWVPRQLEPIPTALAEALRLAAKDGRGGLGSIVVFAAGNGGELATYDRFASAPSVVAVGAADARGKRAYYSDYGPTVLVVAPSSGLAGLPGIWTTDRPGADGLTDGDYTDGFGGTSAAAAVVAGVAGLILARYPALTAAQVIEALARSAVPLDDGCVEYDGEGRSRELGFGRVDAAGALLVASSYGDGCTYGFELCGNERDDDCDGRIDDPECCRTCIPDAGSEICDGRDNDCDGDVDEDFVCMETGRPPCAPCTQSSQCGPGRLCRAAAGMAGTHCFVSCSDGGPCRPGFRCDGEVCVLDDECLDCAAYLRRCGQIERCDGLDNDCDGQIDEAPACDEPGCGCAAAAARGAIVSAPKGRGSVLALLVLVVLGYRRRRRFGD